MAISSQPWAAVVRQLITCLALMTIGQAASIAAGPNLYFTIHECYTRWLPVCWSTHQLVKAVFMVDPR